jgi:curved DNA-binding protein CbpA
MEAEKDYYSMLGVLPSIDDVALAAVYRALLKKYHPDVFSGSKTEAERRTKEIVEAYDILGNPSKRQAYDAERNRDNGFGSYRQDSGTEIKGMSFQHVVVPAAQREKGGKAVIA